MYMFGKHGQIIKFYGKSLEIKRAVKAKKNCKTKK